MAKNKFAIILIWVILLSGCGSSETILPEPGRIHDNDGVYSLPKDDYTTLYISVAPGGSVPFHLVSGADRENGVKISFPITVFDQEETLASEQLAVTGRVQVKRNSPYKGYYRSFKINFDGDNKYLDQGALVLYKNPEDAGRITMRLGMDAYALCDDIVSTRTGFVRLMIRDEETRTSEYDDYGLYIMTENPGGKFLRTHGLDRNGELYSIKDFGLDYEEWLNAGETERSQMVEYENGTDPEKFTRLLKGIAEAEDLNAVFDTYFDRQNYLTWLAASALLGNYQAGTEDYLLYSPTDSEKWYFLPIPTEKILLAESDRKWSTPPESYTGLGWFVEGAVHRRFFQDQNNRQALAAKVDEIRAVLDDRVISSYCEQYKTVLAEFTTRNPDNALLHFTLQETWERIDRIPEMIEANYQLFHSNLKLPLPFDLERITPNDETEGYTVSWQEAAGDDEVTYHLKITGDLAGADVLFEVSTADRTVEIPEEIRGGCYIHLFAENQLGSQPMRSYERGTKASVWGVTYYEFGNPGGRQ